jgi:hypothetical protein
MGVISQKGIPPGQIFLLLSLLLLLLPLLLLLLLCMTH